MYVIVYTISYEDEDVRLSEKTNGFSLARRPTLAR